MLDKKLTCSSKIARDWSSSALLSNAKYTVLRTCSAAPAKKAPTATKKTPRTAAPGSGLTPSAQLAAVIGPTPVLRTEVVKKLWDYIKANGLQDAADKRAINADEKLLAVFGKPQVSMFELAGIVGRHLG